MTRINVLVAGGTGYLGYKLVNALLDDGAYSVAVLARVGTRGENLENIKKRNIRLITVDYGNHAELVQAMQGIDIVASMVDYHAVGEPQFALIRAAKAAGVRRFVPSDFSSNVDTMQRMIHDDPAALERLINEVGIEYTRYFVGFSYAYLFSPFMGIDLENKAFRIIGDGSAAVSIIYSDDIAKYIAASLKDPRSRNAHLYIESATITINQFIATVEKILDIKLTVATEPVGHAKVDPASPNALQEGHLISYLTMLGTGKLQNPRQDNKLFPSVSTLSLEEFLRTRMDEVLME
ncbi:hypothetical protein THASP1DRAFT_13647 [Thamnocephalis sphaerospora]|uniref:NmrA-like domain-containing protein n=1 Tax=Thamnocephalis sphaerospora TaxID=78915 RepID=A0A4P9XV64_9FUNG|nr:hypothetical protein THASP1DRAFT_13647 [Thamnocephalis sphaerospora]|eukprot:RKP09892.1 hypothetical protein THASP1DRAFT_13647 [Thamnocephalis sphaerospora]